MSERVFIVWNRANHQKNYIERVYTSKFGSEEVPFPKIDIFYPCTTYDNFFVKNTIMPAGKKKIWCMSISLSSSCHLYVDHDKARLLALLNNFNVESVYSDVEKNNYAKFTSRNGNIVQVVLSEHAMGR
jgi:hypothetical protein